MLTLLRPITFASLLVTPLILARKPRCLFSFVFGVLYPFFVVDHRNVFKTKVISSEVLPLLLETGECLGPADGYPTLTAVSFSHFYTPLLQASVCVCGGFDVSSEHIFM